jgi:hypothetical protein
MNDGMGEEMKHEGNGSSDYKRSWESVKSGNYPPADFGHHMHS